MARWVLIVALAVLFASLLAVGSAVAGRAEVAPENVARSDEITLSDAEWKQKLTEQEYHVLREQGTERAFSGDLWDHHERGTYVCAACGLPLFASGDKFDSGTGWPSYTQPVARDAVESTTDRTLGMSRTEVHCARCGGHLGHVFPDGPAPTGLRYCINSVSLDFQPAK